MKNPQKTMWTIVLLLILFATAGGIGLTFEYQRVANSDWSGIAPQIASQFEAANAQQKGVVPGSKATSRQAGQNLFAFLEDVLQKIPSGTVVDSTQFDRVLGVEAGNYLRNAQISKIAVKADLFTITLIQPRQIDLNGQADVRVAQQVTFRYQKDKSGAMRMSQIRGLEVRVSWLLGFMDVSQVDVSRGTAGDTLLVVTVDTLFGKTSRSFTIGADGKPKAPSP